MKKDIKQILNENPFKTFGGVPETICILIKYIDTLEQRITELEQKMNLIEDRSDLLQSSEERYYN